jgi:hypothetical protein
MYTVVAKKHAIAIGLFTVPLIVGWLGWTDLDTPAETGKLCSQYFPEPPGSGSVEPYGHEVDV